MVWLFLLLITNVSIWAQSLKLNQTNELTRFVPTPEGLAISPNGVVFAGSLLSGIIHSKSPDEKMFNKFGDLKDQLYTFSEGAKLMGLVAEDDSQVWAAVAGGPRNGCIMSIRKSTYGSLVQPIMCDVGDINGMVIDYKTGHLYATSKDSGLLTSDGRIIKISMANLKEVQNTNKIINFDSSLHTFVELDYPNGIVLSASGDALVVTQTMRDEVVIINLKSREVGSFYTSPDSGWLDGITLIKSSNPTESLYAVVDCKLGKIHLLTTGGSPKKVVSITSPNGIVPGLATPIYHQENLYITDLWQADLIDLTLEQVSGKKFVNYNSHVYKIPLKSLIN